MPMPPSGEIVVLRRWVSREAARADSSSALPVGIAPRAWWQRSLVSHALAAVLSFCLALAISGLA